MIELCEKCAAKLFKKWAKQLAENFDYDSAFPNVWGGK